METTTDEMLKGLGLHHKITDVMQRGLAIYAAANHCNISICILGVNPYAIKLQKLSLLPEQMHSPGRIFKPPAIKGKSRTDSIRAPFLGEYTEASLQQLNREHSQSLPSSDTAAFFRKHSAPVGDSSSEPMKTRTSSEPALKSSNMAYEFNNVNLQYHLSHFRYLHKKNVFTIESMKLKGNILKFHFSETKDENYSTSDIHLVKYTKVCRGKARIQLSERQLRHISKELSLAFSSLTTGQLVDVFFKSNFFRKYKNHLYLQLFDANDNPIKTLGIQIKNHYGHVVTEYAFMADIDIHSLLHSDSLPPSPVLDFSQLTQKPEKKRVFYEAIEQEHNRLKTYLDEYDPEFSAAFDWQDFKFQLFNCKEMGKISAREIVMISWMNRLFGRGHQGFITWILQHGPTNRMPLEHETERFMQQLQLPFARAELEFPAVTPETQILVISTQKGLHAFHGMEILAFYARSENLDSCKLHQHWKLQIQEYLQDNNPNNSDLRRKMLLISKVFPTHSNIHLSQQPSGYGQFNMAPLKRNNSRCFIIDLDGFYTSDDDDDPALLQSVRYPSCPNF